MKLNLSFLLFAISQFIQAQSFSEITPNPFTAVLASSIAFADVNGDGKEDVIITGDTGVFEPTTKLYINDEMGNFTEAPNTPFENIFIGEIAFSDVNLDGTKDLLILGNIDFSTSIAKLYTNDGMGNFTEKTGTPFTTTFGSSLAFSDVNGDGTEDVLITGRNSTLGEVARLYINDGMGNFTEVPNTPFQGVVGGDIDFSDVNSDGSNDVLIIGENNFDAPTTKLYLNDGIGNFTEAMGTSFDDVYRGSTVFFDANGDGIEDVLLTGETSNSDRIAKLYTNDGMGNFTESPNTPFLGVSVSSVACSDINGDGNKDILITGTTNGAFNGATAKLYTNDGLGNFTEVLNTQLQGVSASSVAFSDINGDNNPDLLITGGSPVGPIAKLYINDGAVSSTDNKNIDFSLDFGLFPNPAAHATMFLNVNSEAHSILSIKIYTLDGLLLSEHKETAHSGRYNYSIDIAHLKSGNYFLTLGNDNQMGIQQFMIK